MYAVDDDAMAAFWRDLRDLLEAAGLSDLPSGLVDPTDLDAHWTDPHLLLSQTCGFPFVTYLRGRVRYVATPRFRAEGCVGASYSSALVVRRDDPARTVPDLRGRRAAFNAEQSQSGYNAFRATVAPFARGDRFFAGLVETGSHRASLAAIRTGAADVAAIDAVTLALVRRYHPREVDGLRALAFTERAPGLPLVTGLRTGDADLGRLRRACAAACDPGRPAASALLLDGVAVLDEGDYLALDAMRARAAACGYPDLA